MLSSKVSVKEQLGTLQVLLLCIGVGQSLLFRLSVYLDHEGSGITHIRYKNHLIIGDQQYCQSGPT